ncbi:MAG: DUF4173 domain-containing protein [Candidatus Magasanikbacteria bacterium]
MNLLIPTTSKRTQRLLYVGFALIMAVLFDIFFWKQQLGVSFLLFVLIYLFGLISIAILHKQFNNRLSLFLLIPILVLSADVVLYNNQLVKVGVPFFVAILLIIFTILVSLKNPLKHPFHFSNIPLYSDFILPLKKLKDIYRDLFQWNTAETKKDIFRKIFTGVLIAVPILFVFGLLFAQADVVFSNIMTNFFNIQITPSVTEWIFRSGRVLVLSGLLGSLLYFIFSEEHSLRNFIKDVSKLDHIVVGVILALVNILFLIFVFIQIKYLFGSNNFVMQNGLTFADYARSGFFELAWVVALAAGLVAVILRSYAHHGAPTITKVLQIILILQVGVVAISALRRMHLYQVEYGFTTLRLYVEWFIYFVMLILTSMIVAIIAKRSFREYVYFVEITGLVALTIVCSVNIDRLIAKENVDRYIIEHKELDLLYLDKLSYDAIPEITRAINYGLTPELINLQVWHKDTYLAQKKEAILKKYDSWRSLNFGVVQVLNTINGN